MSNLTSKIHIAAPDSFTNIALCGVTEGHIYSYRSTIVAKIKASGEANWAQWYETCTNCKNHPDYPFILLSNT
jgi:hypothetical protein